MLVDVLCFSSLIAMLEWKGSWDSVSVLFFYLTFALDQYLHIMYLCFYAYLGFSFFSWNCSFLSELILPSMLKDTSFF